MEKMVLILHVVVCFLLIILVLLQSGKEGMGVIFGGGGSSVFGSSGAGGILAKLTGFLAAMFIVTSISYTIMTKPATSAEESVMQSVEPEKGTPPAPLTPVENGAPVLEQVQEGGSVNATEAAPAE